MKKKVISASVYLAAALAMGAYYDAVYGAGPVTRHPLLLRSGVAGAFLFGCASLLSLWKTQRAVFVGILACFLCWSDFARIMPQIPFRQVFSVIGYGYWNETLLALLILILASAYCIRQSWGTFRHPISKPDAGQAFQAGSILLCVILELQVTSGLDSTEFSGGWLTGPLLSIADIGIALFILAFVLTFLVPRVAAAVGFASSLLCLPLSWFFIAPVPFAEVFARGHEFKDPPAPGFHWNTWPVTTLLAVAFALYLCVRRLVVVGSCDPAHS